MSGTKRLDDVQVLLSIIDNLPTSIFVKDEKLKFVYSNALHCKMIGKSEAELLGKCDADFYPEHEARGFLQHDQKVISTGVTDYAEEFASNDSGMTLPVLTRKARHDGPDGKTYLIGTNTDLTEIKAREDQYRALSETVPVGIAQYDEDGNISFANPLFLAYCGGDGDEDAGLALIRKLQAAHADFPGNPCKFETEFTVVGAPPRSVIAISSGWRMMSGKRAAIISLVDVSEMTELRRVNSEISRLNRELAENMKRLKEAQDELVKKGRMEQLGQLTATIAHELRNPLGAVRTSTFLMERKLKGSAHGVDAQIERINKGVVRCDNIITQLLDFSRTRQINAQPDNLDGWLTQVIDEEAKRMPAAISINLDLGLAGRQLPFDPARLQRAVVNLLSNASEAMVGQGDDPSKFAVANPEIRISTRMEDGFAVVEVKDNGPGIPPEVMARIREPLFTTKSFGTGLGVPAIEQIAIQHGGKLDAHSVLGEGACFAVWLPLDGQLGNEAAA
ncbi:MAG: ATP-binding protein [Hyphomicrobiales bacterium]